MSVPARFLHTQGTTVIGIDGEPVRLRGICIGGWLNMENFITGFAANESLMRSGVLDVLGRERYELFFESLLVKLLRGRRTLLSSPPSGSTPSGSPLNYRHLEDDANPFVVKEEGFRHLDRAIAACAANGIYSIIDLHAVPGSQNQHWHSDNATHRAVFWEQRQFQDRAVHLWEAIADHYKDEVWVAGYNLLNEPADESRKAIGPFYARLAGGYPPCGPAPRPVRRREHVRDRVRHLRGTVGQHGLHVPRLRPLRLGARRPIPGPH